MPLADLKASLRRAGINYIVRHPVSIAHYEVAVEKTTVVGVGGNWQALTECSTVNSHGDLAWVCATTEEDAVVNFYGVLLIAKAIDVQENPT